MKTTTTRVEGRKIRKTDQTWELLEAPHRNGNVTRTMGEEPGYLARALYTSGAVKKPVEVTLHVPADIALAWFMANTVPGDSDDVSCPDTLRPGAIR